MFSLFCPEFHTLILMSFWKKTGSMSPIPALPPSKASAVGKIQYSVEGNNGSRELALDKPVITSSLQGLSCTSLILCYIFHLGGNTGNVGNTSSRATLQPLCCFLDYPTLQNHWVVSIWAHTGRLHCWSDSRAVLLTTL